MQECFLRRMTQMEKNMNENMNVQNNNRVVMIKFDDVSKEFHMGDSIIKANDHMSFEVYEGEFVIVVGPSGAGKTTVLNILGGMDSASSGHVYIDGEDITKFNEKELTNYRRYDVGFVFQFYNLMPHLTARENVELANEIVKEPLDTDQVLKSVGLESRMANFPSQLSGGEQQRVSIARAIAKNPKILLCDEPTGALDYETGKQILKLLHDISREMNKTVVIVTHNQAFTKIADKVIKIRNGQILDVTVNENPKDISQISY